MRYVYRYVITFGLWNKYDVMVTIADSWCTSLWILAKYYITLLCYMPHLYLARNHLIFLFYCGIYIPLSDDKHRKVRDSSKKCLGNPRQIQSETKCSPRQNSVWEFFSDGEKNNFFQTEFCLRLNFVSDWICLGLHTAVVFCMQSFYSFVNLFIKTYWY